MHAGKSEHKNIPTIRFGRILIVLFSFLLNPAFSFAQMQTIKGRVLTKKGETPVPNCSVFISNTSRGTMTNNNGEFEIGHVPAGNHELIISSIGYETLVYSFTEKQLPLYLNVKIGVKAVEMDSVTVAPYLKDGWKKWGPFFIQNFIGTEANASGCTIKNAKMIKFRYSRKNDRLTASADEPLIIINKSLGYTISYQLESFFSDFGNNTIGFSGYPFFQEMPVTNAKHNARWQKNRRIAYQLSMMHFMRALYSNELDSQGFTAKEMIRMENLEKKRVKALYEKASEDTLVRMNQDLVKMSKLELFSRDSLNYYQYILKKPDYYETLGPHIPGDRLFSKDTSGVGEFFFEGTLYVSYLNTRAGLSQQSSIKLMTPKSVQIWPNGNYFPPGEIFTMGSWAKSEKISNLLPIDYEPGNQ